MKSLLYIICPVALIMAIASCTHPKVSGVQPKDVLAENDSVQILSAVEDSAKDEFDVDVISLWIRNKTTGKEKKLLQTSRPTWHCWYMGDGEQFFEESIDSIPSISSAFIINDDPLKIIVQGVPDCRNHFTYMIEVDKRKAWYIPANNGFVGLTAEEGYLIFQSYRYVSDPDIAGRYSYLQVFDGETGVMVDSLDLEHIILEKYDSPYAKKK